MFGPWDLNGLLVDRPRIVGLRRLRLDEQGSGSYRLHDLWALALFEYYGTVEIGSVRYALTPDRALLMTPGTTRRFRLNGPSVHRAAHFRWGPGPGETAVLLHGGPAALRLRDDFDEMLPLLDTQPRRADVRLWDMLWRVADMPTVAGGPDATRHPALRRALAHLEAHLAEPLRVTDLAEAANVSHNHLTRLFRRALGTTPIRYIRRRRMLQAEHLLRYSDLPIKVIAAQVGIADLQKFNRTAHAVWGCSPRARRRRGRPDGDKPTP